MTGGTYTLVVDLPEPTSLRVGALGVHRLPAGAYAYTGSARGPGGFARLERHREVAAGDRSVRHWHVDHLLGHDPVAVVADVRAPGADVECDVARALPAGPVPGFGASDCDCRAHLGRFDDTEAARDAVRTAHASFR